MCLLHVLVHLIPPSGRTYVFLTQNYLLLHSYCLCFIGCVIKYKKVQCCQFTVFLLLWLKSYVTHAILMLQTLKIHNRNLLLIVHMYIFVSE